MHVDMGSMARLEIPKDAAACCFGKCPNPSNRLISRLLEWPGWTGFSRTSPEIYDLGLCVFPRSNACRNSFAMERCQQLKVAAPQRGSLLLCKDDSWFYWFSHRECVPMAEWSIRTWRWRDIVYGVSFYNSDGATLGWWLFCCIFLSKNSDFRPWKNSDRCLIKKNKFWTSTTPEILIVVLSNGEKITLCVWSPFWKILSALWISSPTHSNLLLNPYPRKLHQNIEQHESSSC